MSASKLSATVWASEAVIQALLPVALQSGDFQTPQLPPQVAAAALLTKRRLEARTMEAERILMMI
jgi:hypothetical protein